MQRELWTRDDLRNAIMAAYFAGVVAPATRHNEDADIYLDGFRAALTTLALNFGLPAPLFGQEPAAPGRPVPQGAKGQLPSVRGGHSR